MCGLIFTNGPVECPQGSPTQLSHYEHEPRIVWASVSVLDSGLVLNEVKIKRFGNVIEFFAARQIELKPLPEEEASEKTAESGERITFDGLKKPVWQRMRTFVMWLFIGFTISMWPRRKRRVWTANELNYLWGQITEIK